MTDRDALTRLLVEHFSLSGLQIGQAADAILALSPLPAREPVAWRWRSKGGTNWIYDPAPGWLEKQGDAIEKERLYALPPAVDRDAVAAEREACAKIAETFCDNQHIAHDMREGRFPNRSRRQEAIAAAIRNRGGDETPAPVLQERSTPEAT